MSKADYKKQLLEQNTEFLNKTWPNSFDGWFPAEFRPSARRKTAFIAGTEISQSYVEQIRCITTITKIAKENGVSPQALQALWSEGGILRTAALESGKLPPTLTLEAARRARDEMRLKYSAKQARRGKTVQGSSDDVPDQEQHPPRGTKRAATARDPTATSIRRKMNPTRQNDVLASRRSNANAQNRLVPSIDRNGTSLPSMESSHGLPPDREEEVTTRQLGSPHVDPGQKTTTNRPNTSSSVSETETIRAGTPSEYATAANENEPATLNQESLAQPSDTQTTPPQMSTTRETESTRMPVDPNLENYFPLPTTYPHVERPPARVAPMSPTCRGKVTSNTVRTADSTLCHLINTLEAQITKRTARTEERRSLEAAIGAVLRLNIWSTEREALHKEEEAMAQIRNTVVCGQLALLDEQDALIGAWRVLLDEAGAGPEEYTQFKTAEKMSAERRAGLHDERIQAGNGSNWAQQPRFGIVQESA